MCPRVDPGEEDSWGPGMPVPPEGTANPPCRCWGGSRTPSGQRRGLTLMRRLGPGWRGTPERGLPPYEAARARLEGYAGGGLPPCSGAADRASPRCRPLFQIKRARLPLALAVLPRRPVGRKTPSIYTSGDNKGANPLLRLCLGAPRSWPGQQQLSHAAGMPCSRAAVSHEGGERRWWRWLRWCLWPVAGDNAGSGSPGMLHAVGALAPSAAEGRGRGARLRSRRGLVGSRCEDEKPGPSFPWLGAPGWARWGSVPKGFPHPSAPAGVWQPEPAAAAPVPWERTVPGLAERAASGAEVGAGAPFPTWFLCIFVWQLSVSTSKTNQTLSVDFILNSLICPGGAAAAAAASASQE